MICRHALVILSKAFSLQVVEYSLCSYLHFIFKIVLKCPVCDAQVDTESYQNKPNFLFAKRKRYFSQQLVLEALDS